MVAGATRARPWNCGNHLAVPLFPFYHSSLSGVPVVIFYLISYYLCHKSAPLELWGPPCCPSLPLLPQPSLWCAGGNLLSHFLLSLFFSQKLPPPPLRGARTPDKHGAIEGAECSWSSELLRAGVGLPEPKNSRTQEPISVVRRCL